MFNDIERLRAEVRAFVQSCGEGDDIAEDVLKELLELYRLTGRPVQELWRQHLRSICCLEWMGSINAHSCSQTRRREAA
jgi:hypothetical protein